jgi:hypothetical protein
MVALLQVQVPYKVLQGLLIQVVEAAAVLVDILQEPQVRLAVLV